VVTIADQSALGTFDEAPVQVAVVADQRKDVLDRTGCRAARAGRGRLRSPGRRGLHYPHRAVRVGLFAGGRVEVSGDGIDAGTVVGMPT